MGRKIAIIGTGISGLGAAWALHKDHDITVFEADSRIGGHSNTVDVALPGGDVAVDTGFIVYNEVTYPHLTRLFAALDVPTEASDMSFAFSRPGFEYAGSLRGLLAQPSNLARSRFRSMITDINRFRRVGGQLPIDGDESIGSFLRRHKFSEGFVEDYLLPMTGAIWSATVDEVGRTSARSILDFLGNHGLIDITGRPQWRTVTGGSRRYVDRLAAPFLDQIRMKSPVSKVVRVGQQVMVVSLGRTEVFDEIILACHSDQALDILGEDASNDERAALSAIAYQPNIAVLHSDIDLMPRRRNIWSSWNAMADTNNHVAVTYWMNRLQNLDTQTPLFVTLNPTTPPKSTYATFQYAHPAFRAGAVEAQRDLAQMQGRQNTWFAGAYLGYGFHEDGLQSGLNVAAALGSPVPWHDSFEPMSSVPALPLSVRQQ